MCMLSDSYFLMAHLLLKIGCLLSGKYLERKPLQSFSGKTYFFVQANSRYSYHTLPGIDLRLMHSHPAFAAMQERGHHFPLWVQHMPGLLWHLSKDSSMGTDLMSGSTSFSWENWGRGRDHFPTFVAGLFRACCRHVRVNAKAHFKGQGIPGMGAQVVLG